MILVVVFTFFLLLAFNYYILMQNDQIHSPALQPKLTQRAATQVDGNKTKSPLRVHEVTGKRTPQILPVALLASNKSRQTATSTELFTTRKPTIQFNTISTQRAGKRRTASLSPPVTGSTTTSTSIFTSMVSVRDAQHGPTENVLSMTTEIAYHSDRAINATAPSTSKQNINESKRNETQAKMTTNLTSSDPPDVILLSPAEGRVGNHLFQLASAYGIAKRTNRKLLLKGNFRDVSDYVEGSFEMLTSVKQLISIIVPKLEETASCSLDKNLYNLSQFEDYQAVQTEAYMQSWMYFGDALDDIRRIFTFRQEVTKRAEKFLSKLANETIESLKTVSNANSNTWITKSDAETEIKDQTEMLPDSNNNNNEKTIFIGVHVRRGDMTTSENRNFGYSTGDADYIERALLHYLRPKRFYHVTFIVCSDDLAWCRRNIKTHLPDVSNDEFRVTFCSHGNEPIIDLGILSACNHSIITGGTFGWWSAFLAGGETVYYKGFPRSGSLVEQQFSRTRTDYWLPDWIGLE